jgi:hypothetical protein
MMKDKALDAHIPSATRLKAPTVVLTLFVLVKVDGGEFIPEIVLAGNGELIPSITINFIQ